MRKIGVLLVIIMVSGGCNLSTNPPTEIPTYPPPPSESSSVQPTASPAGVLPTLLPLPPLPATNIPVTSVPLLGSLCQVYTTYSGSDPNNKVSLRQTPSATALQVLRVPNNAAVLLVPGSPEVEAEGYHWLNVVYVDAAQIRYLGWIARDSYTVNGVPDPTIPTLRQAGTQAGC